MAIEPLKKITAVVPADSLPQFTDQLHRQAYLHLIEIEDELPACYSPPAGPREGAQEKVNRLEQILAFCEEWGAGRLGFLDSIFSTQTCATVAQLEEAAHKIDSEELFRTVGILRSRRDLLTQKLNAAEKEAAALSLFARVELPLAFIAGLSHARLELVKLSKAAQEELARACPETMSYERLAGDFFWLAFPRGEQGEAAFIAQIGAAKEAVPQLAITARERLAAIAQEKKGLQEQLSSLGEECRRFASQTKTIELALGYWQAELHRLEGIQKMRSSQRLGIAHGYLPARELDGFQREVTGDFAGQVFASDPRPTDHVPVKIALPAFFRPVQLLINMFGVPDYFSIDPTPFLTFVFLAFFGICFGDGIYGIMLIILSLLLMRKYRQQENLRSFFQLFLYCGVSTLIFGALTGSWAGDLSDPKYLGENNFLLRIKEAIPYFDPLQNTMFALVICIGIGILNQYYGILMLIWRNWRRGDRKGAIFDGALWYLYLTGIVIIVAGLFVPVPAAAGRVGLILLAAGVVGLLLTQGRDQQSFTGKIVYGVISLYGILGSYGATSFIGDVLSYSRLLALGLTTSIVGASFNILGGIFAGIPYIGILIAIGIIVFGHVFNFLMSIIGSFVHPTRLMLLEFFGRFYEAGGHRFEPFGYASRRVLIIGERGRK